MKSILKTSSQTAPIIDNLDNYELGFYYNNDDTKYNLNRNALYIRDNDTLINVNKNSTPSGSCQFEIYDKTLHGPDDFNKKLDDGLSLTIDMYTTLTLMFNTTAFIDKTYEIEILVYNYLNDGTFDIHKKTASIQTKATDTNNLKYYLYFNNNGAAKNTADETTTTIINSDILSGAYYAGSTALIKTENFKLYGNNAKIIISYILVIVNDKKYSIKTTFDFSTSQYFNTYFECNTLIEDEAK